MSNSQLLERDCVDEIAQVPVLCSIVILSGFYSRYQVLAFCTGIVTERLQNSSFDGKGLGAAYNKLRQESRLRAGTFVGQDYNGNKYFEDKNAPYGAPRKSPAPLHPHI